ncbi:alpha-2-macroglobulin [Microcaecilia unicolor]|uniref:Alpha-2-macroglobulin-like n=1 Tax=Microcaecilia unicolor TaxID=1415580 RepID=A0A6P7WPL3_9AMPH|nr:alpha-2-macroglobulin-like [Microcaecilia unicolor]
MKAQGSDGGVLMNQKVYLAVQIDGQVGQTEKRFLTDSQGMVTFTLDTSDWTNSVNLQAMGKGGVVVHGQKTSSTVGCDHRVLSDGRPAGIENWPAAECSPRVAVDQSVLLLKPESELSNQTLKQPFVKCVDTTKELINICLDEVKKESHKYTASLSRDYDIGNVKPATVRVYDYYKPDEFAEVEYIASC